VIVLNPDKEIIVVQSWDDISRRPGFNGNLDPRAHELKSIIGRYALRDYVPCGLADCHTPHGRGYIVVTKDGQETNIGKDCGQKYFGVDFETLSSKFDRDLQEKENREKVFSFVFRIDEVFTRIRALRGGERGADWAYKAGLPLASGSKDVPNTVVRRLAQMVKTRSPVLEAAREATEQEVAQIERQTGRRIKERPHYVSTPIATINGLEALYPENNLRQLLVLDLEEPLKELDAVDVASMSFADLKRWARWVGEVDVKLEHAEAAVAHGRRLLVQSNLAPLIDALELSSEQVKQFKRYLKALPA